MHKENIGFQVNCHKSYRVDFTGPPVYDYDDCCNEEGHVTVTELISCHKSGGYSSKMNHAKEKSYNEDPCYNL